MAVTLLSEANPDWVVSALDILNAFNEIQRYSILEVLLEMELYRSLTTTTTTSTGSVRKAHPSARVGPGAGGRCRTKFVKRFSHVAKIINYRFGLWTITYIFPTKRKSLEEMGKTHTTIKTKESQITLD